MSDRPDHVVDHDNDQPIDHDNQLQGWSLEAAADQLGISVNAVRQRIKRGTLPADRLADGWVVYMPTDQETRMNHGRQPTDRPSTGARQTTNQPDDHVGIAPLVSLVADLTRQNAELSAAAALWQERARFLGERLAAIEAGPISAPERENAPVSTPEASQRDEAPQMDNEPLQDAEFDPVPTDVQLATGWRRWWRRVMGYEG